MRNVALFLICVAVSSVGLQKMFTPNTHGVVASADKKVILGHRIGPGNQEMLVVR